MRGKHIRSLIIVAILAVGALVATNIARAANASNSDPDYAAIRRAGLDGKDIRMVLDLSACTTQQSGRPGPNVSGSLRFDGYMIEGGQTIAFAMTHFTLRPDKTPVYEFLAFRPVS